MWTPTTRLQHSRPVTRYQTDLIKPEEPEGFALQRVDRSGGATPVAVIVARVNAVVAGWVNYFRVGNSSRAFSEVRDYLEMKIRTLLTRRKRRRKTSIGWWRWSNAYVYGVLGLYWDWKIHPLPSATAYA